MGELKTRVEELRLENDYQLRLKDMTYSEKIKELTEKFVQEMESLKTKNQACTFYTHTAYSACCCLIVLFFCVSIAFIVYACIYLARGLQYLHCALVSCGAVYCNRSCLSACEFATGGRARGRAGGVRTLLQPARAVFASL